MKKIKKIFALILSMAMVLGMSVTSFAAISGASITVKGLATTGTQTVKIYKIYGLDDNNNLWEKSDWATAIESESDLENAGKIDALVDQVPTTPDGNKETENGTATFSNLEAGAYLVIAVDEDNKTTYSPMIAITYQYDETSNIMVAANASVVAKAESYNITKEIKEDEDSVFEVGDLIEYEIRTTVPYIADNSTNVSFTISDTLTGATYYLSGEAVKGVEAKNTVTVGGTTVGAITIPAEANGGTNFTVNLDSLVTTNTNGIYDNTYAGQEVVITYTARVNAVDEITNDADSNHVGTPDSGADVTVKAYTGQITITKYGEGTEETRPELSGAEFAIYRIQGETKQYAKIDASGYITGEWISEETEGEVPTEAGKVTTGTDGTATVKGLNVGTYYFKETKAPNGYSINTEDVSGEITKTETAGVVTVTGSTSMNDTKLANLPSTGGIGTTIFTIGGCAIMIAAAALFFASRRKISK